LEQDPKNEQVLSRYLLGQLTEEEQEQIEERYFNDKEFFEQLLVVEDTLIDNYVRHRLSGVERQHFESHFMRSPERRERVEVAGLWMEYIDRNSLHKQVLTFEKRSTPQRPLTRTPALLISWAAMILLMLGGSWLLIDRARLKGDLNQARDEREAFEREQAEAQQRLAEQNARNQQLAEELEQRNKVDDADKIPQPRPQDALSGVVAFLLTSTGVRGGAGSTTLNIPPRTERVRLQVRLDNDEHNTYQAVIKNIEGKEIGSRTGLRARPDKIISITLPANIFAEDDYILTLDGVKASGEKDVIGEYPFRISRKGRN
jgi:hypothetical protein